MAFHGENLKKFNIPASDLNLDSFFGLSVVSSIANSLFYFNLDINV